SELLKSVFERDAVQSHVVPIDVLPGSFQQCFRRRVFAQDHKGARRCVCVRRRQDLRAKAMLSELRSQLRCECVRRIPGWKEAAYAFSIFGKRRGNIHAPTFGGFYRSESRCLHGGILPYTALKSRSFLKNRYTWSPILPIKDHPTGWTDP